jgi:hypothetical protein
MKLDGELYWRMIDFIKRKMRSFMNEFMIQKKFLVIEEIMDENPEGGSGVKIEDSIIEYKVEFECLLKLIRNSTIQEIKQELLKVLEKIFIILSIEILFTTSKENFENFFSIFSPEMKELIPTFSIDHLNHLVSNGETLENDQIREELINKHIIVIKN